MFILPSLACQIGLNEALVLQTIHEILAFSREAELNFIEHRYWVFKSSSDWQKQFPFWSEKTIIRTLSKLRKSNLVIAKNLNSDPMDRTLWYTIDYNYLIQYVPNNPHRA